MFRIEEASTPARVEQIRSLFREYEAWLGMDLCFQGFEAELAGLPGRYARPEGRLLVALDGEEGVGCVALRKLEPGVCEMKRLFVRPSHQGQGLGRALAERLLREAAAIGYLRMRLDTLPLMSAARQLYATLGFREIPPYYENPLAGVLYMELDLTARAPGRQGGGPSVRNPGAA
jgi:GNAT superfamily N-acetyltransferase